MDRRLVFTGKNEITLEDIELPAPKAGEVLIRNTCSLISTGTETIALHRRFDEDTNWAKWVRYPFYPGYASIGEVEAVGEEVEGLAPGDRVAHRARHATAALRPADACWPVPEGLGSEEASWFALAKIAAMGARVAGHVLGRCVVIVGAGPVGQMAIRWAHAAGAEPLVVVDMIQARLDMAERAGAVRTIRGPIAEALDTIKEINGGELADVVIDCTGHAAVFADALAVPRNRGRFVILGDTGTPGQQRLTTDVINRGLTVVGAHDGHEDPTWNRDMLIPLFFRLCRTGRFSVEGLVTHRFHFEDYADAYRTADEARDKAMGVLFDWTGGAKG